MQLLILTIRVTGTPIAAFVRAIVLAAKSANMDIFGLNFHLAMFCEVTFVIYSIVFTCVAPMLFDLKKVPREGPDVQRGCGLLKALCNIKCFGI